jgi:hypothetical protein
MDQPHRPQIRQSATSVPRPVLMSPGRSPRAKASTGSRATVLHMVWMSVWTGGGRRERLVDNHQHLVDTLLTRKRNPEDAPSSPCATRIAGSRTSLSPTARPRPTTDSSAARHRRQHVSTLGEGRATDPNPAGNRERCQVANARPRQSPRRPPRGGATRPSEAPPSHTWRGLGLFHSHNHTRPVARACSRQLCPSGPTRSPRRAESGRRTAT